VAIAHRKRPTAVQYEGRTHRVSVQVQRSLRQADGGSVVSVLPMLVLLLILRRRIIESVALTGLKG
jgi:hypothetical protein